MRLAALAISLVWLAAASPVAAEGPWHVAAVAALGAPAHTDIDVFAAFPAFELAAGWRANRFLALELAAGRQATSMSRRIAVSGPDPLALLRVELVLVPVIARARFAVRAGPILLVTHAGAGVLDVGWEMTPPNVLGDSTRRDTAPVLEAGAGVEVPLTTGLAAGLELRRMVATAFDPGLRVDTWSLAVRVAWRP